MLISDWSSDVCSSDLVDGGSLTVTGTNTLGIATDGALAVEALNGGTLDAVNLVTVSGGTTTLRADNGVIGGDNFTISGGNLQVQGVGSGRIDVAGTLRMFAPGNITELGRASCGERGG